jgi:DNA (cytosine-5)-methyltransferase 1
MRIGDAFAGIGGLGLAASWVTGGDVAWQIEHDRAAADVLSARRGAAGTFCDDVRKISGPMLSPVDLLTGGFPCQDLSVAGSRVGLDGARSGLYREMMRLTSELRPGAVLLENVPALLKYRDRLEAELAELGYLSVWYKLGAIDAGAPHRRSRVFVLAWRPGGLPPRARIFDDPKWTPEGDASLWPTPRARDAAPEGVEAGRRRILAYSTCGLSTAVTPWPTPLAMDARGPGLSKARQGDVSGVPLSVAVSPWPTPTCGDAKASGGRSAPSNNCHNGASLTDAVRPDRATPWPTPTACNRNDGEDLSRWIERSAAVAKYSSPVSPPLAVAVAMAAQGVPWPTPATADGNGSRMPPAGTSATGVRPDGSKATIGLQAAISLSGPWPTPLSRDGKSGAGANGGRGHSPGLPEVLRGRLNPSWVESLMGFPVGWTDPAVVTVDADAHALISAPRWPAGWVRSDPAAGPQFAWESPRLVYGDARRGRPARLRQLGNAVCPMQGAAALSMLIELAWLREVEG